MRRIMMLILILLMSGYSVDATTVSQRWVKTYGGKAFTGDAYSIQQTSDGGYVLGGMTMPLFTGGMDGWVLKLDSNGNEVWQKKYGGGGSDGIYAIRETLDGGYIMAGYSFSFGYLQSDIWILKLDKMGNITWQKTYGGFDSEQAYSIQQTTDKGYIVAGSTSSFGASMQEDAWVLKLDSNGNVIWQKAYDIKINEALHSVQQTTDGGFIVAGFTGSWEIDDTDIWILKLDPFGNISWQKTFGGNSIDLANAVQQTEDGEYIIVCKAGSLGGALILKLDSNGNVIWQKSYTDWDFSHFQQLQNGGYILSGAYRSSSLNYGGIMKLDSSGNVIWQKTYGGGALADFLKSIQTTKDGGYIATGLTDSLAVFQAWTLKIDSSSGEIPDCDIVGAGDTIVSDASFTAEDNNTIIYTSSGMMAHTTVTPQDIPAVASVICYYENPDDIDGDGVSNNPANLISDTIIRGGKLLAAEDNCPDVPNGPYLGTCTKDNIGNTCIADVACGDGGICSMNQEDSFPLGGNNCGDACECHADCNSDQKVDLADLVIIKQQFLWNCSQHPFCEADCNYSGKVDLSDLVMMKNEFMRSDCPVCP